ncbi:hypothetical protein ACFSM5_15685 [Lacibacterium aquatile]|uniref:Phage tail assembly protein n=1 Tax=Lacibacterium aquatile TaxID=1168082 RepID=A0ABW5DV15_9PROT
MSDIVTYELKFPIQFTASRYVDQLVFKTSLKVRDYKRLDQATGAIEQVALTLALLAGEPIELIDAMDTEDFQGAIKQTRPFLNRLLGNGEA